MALKDLVPFIGPLERARGKDNSPTPALDQDDLRVLPKLFRSIGLAVGYTGGTYSIGYNRVNFEPAPYDFDRIIQAIDTDSYVKQGFNQYKELFWKEGYTIISQNPEAVEYLKLRIQFMELSMKKSFNNFLVDVADQLVKFGNCFSGEEEFLTQEYGPIKFNEVVNEKITVYGEKGWTPATVHSFGKQPIQKITFVNTHPSSKGRGYTKESRSNYRVEIKATPDHRWILVDGAETTALSVGDVVAMNKVIDKTGDDYQEGLRQGIIFGDGSFDYKYRKSDLSSYKVRLCGKKREFAYLFDKVNPFQPNNPDGDLVAFHIAARDLKTLPYSGSPAFFNGFLDGWILTDGHLQDPYNAILASQHPEAKDWAERFAAMAGWVFRGFGIQTTGGYLKERAHPCYRIQLSRREDLPLKVESIETLPEKEEVFCAVVPEGAAFTLRAGILTGNCFVVKVRADINEFFPIDIHPVYGTKPVIGYELLPAETVEIMRDYHNKPIKYRQNIWGAHGYNAPSGFGRGERGYANLLPTWKPEQMIHFSVDVKPGRLFGTPFFVAVMDDVIALRQVEEDVQNLVHRELFPLYKYIVGTEEHPAEPDEINAAVHQIEGLGSGGGIVLPERHDIDVVGSQGKALDIQPYLDHFKERVAVGMGLTKKRLGMSQPNAAKDEEDDTKIFDKIKQYQKTFGELIRLHFLNELLLEADFDPFIAHKDRLDTCYFIFNEIDVDTQVKKENHIVQKWISDLIIWEEARIQLKEPLDADRQELYTAISNRELAPPEAPGKPIKPGSGTPAWTSNLKNKGAKQRKPASGGSPATAEGGVSVNKPSVATRGGSNNTAKLTGPPAITKSTNTSPRQKAVANKSMPTNQFGSRISSISKRTQHIKADNSDLAFIESLVELINDNEPN